MISKIIYTVIGLVTIVMGFLFFDKEFSAKNYPSNGKDIIVFGDSLVSGVGATSEDKNFVSLLESIIGKPIINLGIPGNTTADGLARLKELDKYDPKVVLILLGGNDYLRKVPINETFNNLERIIKNIQDRGSVVVLLGIRGGILNDNFEPKFEELSKKYQTAYVTDVLSGLITNKEYMYDSIHPNDLGYDKIARRVYPVLNKVIK